MAVGLVMNNNLASNFNPMDRSRFSLNFSSTSPTGSRLTHWDLSPTDSISPAESQTPNQSMLASPVMNMPVLCRPYNAYSPVSGIQTMASPSNTFENSPGNSSPYSASPLNSPQQQMQPEDFLRYNMQQNYRQPIAPSVEYGYYGYNEFGMKRRKRDDELTAEEYEKRRVRRERNKQAALRCRTRRRERIDALEQETNQIEEDNEKVQSEIKGLREQIEELKNLLKEHGCQKRVGEVGVNNAVPTIKTTVTTSS